MSSSSSKKPSFFRRMSLSSPSSRKDAVTTSQAPHLSEKDSGRNHSPLNGLPAAANPLNLPPGAAPSAYKASNVSNIATSPPRHRQVGSRGTTPIATASVRSPSETLSRSMRPSSSVSPSAQQPLSPPTSPSSHRRQRQPIYPALASPPTSPPDFSSPRSRNSSISPSKRSTEPVGSGGWDLAELSFGPNDSRYNVLPARRISNTVQPEPERPPLGSRVSSSRRNGSTGRVSVQTPPSAFPKSTRAPHSDHGPHTNVSEASAYALAVSSTLVKDSRSRDHLSREGTASAPPEINDARPSARPLPRPPAPNQGHSLHIIAANDGTGRKNMNAKQVEPGQKTRPTVVIPPDVRSSFINFPRSPTLPALIDPRKAEPIPPTETQAHAQPLAKHLLPTRTSSVRIPSSSSARIQPAPASVPPQSAPVSASPSSLGPLTLATVLAQPQIQAVLLPYLSINSFLSLTGASEQVRKRLTGEVVGRWVMREWGILVDRERGRSWPNLTVWEGFLESLLHDPATYSTYPPQWHNLLRHLSLSHTLIVLHLRSLPSTAFPMVAPMPFDEDASIPYSQSVGSLSSLPRSRVGSDAGSIAPGKMPKHERLLEIVMPEPLAAKPEVDNGPARLETEVAGRKLQRRSSISSMASAASFSFGRKRSSSVTSAVISPTVVAAPMASSGKAALPPVSYPTAKRYGFKRHGDPPPARSRTFSENSRPGSVFSVSSSPSVALSQWMTTQRPPVPTLSSTFVPPVINGSHRVSLGSAQSGQSPVPRHGSPMGRDYYSPPSKIEPAFDKPLPYVQGRAPILRVFVPISDSVRRWPSAEGAAAAVAELDKSGAKRRLRLGDLVVNTAYRQPKTTEHVLIYVPYIKHLLVPLEYKHCQAGHLPSYVDAFGIPPSYYYPFLQSPQIVYLDLAPYADRALRSLRLAFDRRDVTVASGARMTAKRYLHVAGFEVVQGDPAVDEWQGMVSLEAEGTAEGKAELLARFRGGRLWPWEIVREKSMSGTVWLRMISES